MEDGRGINICTCLLRPEDETDVCVYFSMPAVAQTTTLTGRALPLASQFKECLMPAARRTLLAVEATCSHLRLRLVISM